MGKSLSILAITTQVYNINGWSIWPPHLALGDDVELPISMEHLRPYLRKRKGPIIAPPGLRHNQRYYPKHMQSRQILSQSVPSEFESSESSEDEVTLIDEIMMEIKQAYGSNLPCPQFQSDFVDPFRKATYDPVESDIQNVRESYQRNKFDPCMVMFINDLVTKIRDNELQNGRIVNTLQKVTSVTRTKQRDEMTLTDKLVITLKSLSQDIIIANEDSLWKYGIWYDLLYDQAVHEKLVPSVDIFDDVDAVANITEQVQPFRDLQLGIISFTRTNFKYKYIFKTHKKWKFNEYMEHMRTMIEDKDKYPYLKNAHDSRTEYIFRVFYYLNQYGEIGDLHEFAKDHPDYIELIQDSFTGLYELSQQGAIHLQKIKKYGPWLAKHGLATTFLPRNKDVVNLYIFNKDEFDDVSVKRRVNAEPEWIEYMEYLYSLSFISQELMYGSMEEDRRDVIIWTYQHLISKETVDHLNQRDKEHDGELFEAFGWIYDDHILAESIKFKGSGIDFNGYMEYLMDIENWQNKEIEVKFKVPHLNTIAFKAEYLVKVLKDTGYSLQGHKVQNDKEARAIITVQNVLNGWYDEYHDKQSPVDNSIIDARFSKDLLEKDYKHMIQDIAKEQIQGNTTAVTQAALKYFFDEIEV